MKIGVIGAGQIGAALIKQYAKAGHEVKMTNSGELQKLSALEKESGAKAVSLSEVIHDIDVLAIAVPLIEIPKLAKEISQKITPATTVIDTANYYPIRDGRIAALENGMPESIWVSSHLMHPVVKVYNTILAGSLMEEGRAKNAQPRIALPISGDDPQAKEIVKRLLNDSGFDALDIGTLADSWRQQPGSPIYCTDLNLLQLQRNVAKVQRDVLAQRRELALQYILKQQPSQWLKWRKDGVMNNRMVYQTDLKT